MRGDQSDDVEDLGVGEGAGAQGAEGLNRGSSARPAGPLALLLEGLVAPALDLWLEGVEGEGREAGGGGEDRGHGLREALLKALHEAG